MDLTELSSGLLIPKEKPASPPKPIPVEPLVSVPYGNLPDGGFVLCPEVMKTFHRLMLERGSQIQPAVSPMRILSDAIWHHQGISFEEWT